MGATSLLEIEKMLKMLIRTLFLLILTLIRELFLSILNGISHISHRCDEDSTYCLMVFASVVAISLSFIAIQKKFKATNRPDPTTYDVSANCHSNLTHSIVQEIKSIDDRTLVDTTPDNSIGEEDEEEENAHNQLEQSQGAQDSDSDSGVG